MNLYKVVRFKGIDMSAVKEPAYIVTDPSQITYRDNDVVSDFQQGENDSQVDRLAEGESCCIWFEPKDRKEGIRVTRLPAFRMNAVMWDEHAKEYVRVTNGRCVLDHSSTEAFKLSHASTNETDRTATPWPFDKPLARQIECVMVACEAIALRPRIEAGKVLLAWTYRAVDPCNLVAVSNDMERNVGYEFETVMEASRDRRTKRSRTFVGRI